MLMMPSRMFQIGFATLAVWWGLIGLQTSWSAAQVQEGIKPAQAGPEAESQAGETDAAKRAAEELVGLRQRAKALSEALEAKKQALTPRLREAQSQVQRLRAALEKAVGLDASKTLEDELHVGQESLSLFEHELALGEEEVTVAESMVTVAEKIEDQRRTKEQQPAEVTNDPLTAQDARVATEEAKVAADKASLAQSKIETLQDDLRNFEKEVADSHVLATTIDLEMKSVAEKLSTHSGGEEKDLLERQLRQARQRAEIVQKRAELTQRQ